MGILEIVLATAIVLEGLVAGLVFTFAIVVMPGIRNLPDRDFLRAFQVMDHVIQENQPAFVIVWLGSGVAALALLVLGAWQTSGLDRWVAVVSSAIFLLGVHLPTITINIPLNNRLQSCDLAAMSEPELAECRQQFEPRWNRWNVNRTWLAVLTLAAWSWLALLL